MIWSPCRRRVCQRGQVAFHRNTPRGDPGFRDSGKPEHRRQKGDFTIVDGLAVLINEEKIQAERRGAEGRWDLSPNAAPADGEPPPILQRQYSTTG